MNSLKDAETDQLRRPTGLANEVYDALYKQLMSLKIPPGGRISVDQLVRSLGVSQTPIREALSRLEAQGLVVKQHLIGYSAAEQLNQEKLIELYEMRLLLEPFAAARLARDRNDAVIAELKALDLQMRGVDMARTRSAYGEFAKCDAAFHNYIAKAAGNTLVYEALQRLNVHAHLFRLYFHSRATSDANREHESLISSIENGDPAGAEKAMRKHLERSKARFEGAFFEV